MRIVFMGTPDFGATVLESLIQKHEVVLVVTQPDSFQGRKKILTKNPVKLVAEKYGIEVFQPEKIKDDYKPIIDKNPDLIVTAAFGQFIPSAVINQPKYKAINVHGSLLPKYRGGAPIQRSIINGDSETGITIMYMAHKMDAGDIIAQRSIKILDEDNSETLFAKLAVLGARLLEEVLVDLEKGNLHPIPQNEDEVTFALNIHHEEQFIDWNKSAKDIHNLIRGLAPNPSALTSYDGIIFKIFKSKIVSLSEDATPRTIIINKKNLLVKTKDDFISILEIQQSGKNKMDIQSFLNGQKVLNTGCKFQNDII